MSREILRSRQVRIAVAREAQTACTHAPAMPHVLLCTLPMIVSEAVPRHSAGTHMAAPNPVAILPPRPRGRAEERFFATTRKLTPSINPPDRRTF